MSPALVAASAGMAVTTSTAAATTTARKVRRMPYASQSTGERVRHRKGTVPHPRGTRDQLPAVAGALLAGALDCGAPDGWLPPDTVSSAEPPSKSCATK